jgi:hypothetical protein
MRREDNSVRLTLIFGYYAVKGKRKAISYSSTVSIS